MSIPIRSIIENITGIDREFVAKARERTAQLAIPPRALGNLHDLGERLCGIFSSLAPDISDKRIFVMAGDHGVVREGVSAFPQAVTGEMVKNFMRGGASINVLAAQLPASVTVVDMGIVPEFPETGNLLVRKIGKGTANIAGGPAMSREEAERSLLTGFEVCAQAIQGGARLIGTGDMGIANTTPSSAIASVILGKDPEEVSGRGTGIDDCAFQRKCGIIKKAIETNNADPSDGIDVLAKLGGYEIGGIAGLILAAAHHKRPVVIDGLISTAGALIAYQLNPLVKEYIFAGHASVERGHRHMLSYMGLEPILDLGLRLGEGTGAALAMHILEAASGIFKHVLTFEEAGVGK
jgi:nicotinate-nucleotide--dimethylbenzimidazole phosphoribosyltransferase